MEDSNDNLPQLNRKKEGEDVEKKTKTKNIETKRDVKFHTTTSTCSLILRTELGETERQCEWQETTQEKIALVKQLKAIKLGVIAE